MEFQWRYRIEVHDDPRNAPVDGPTQWPLRHLEELLEELIAIAGRYKGHFHVATSNDGSQGMFPLDFAIVDAENQDNWMWFLSQLLKAVGSSRRLTFVFDRQHGLLEALSVVFSNAHHAYCLNYLKRFD
ncbi:uncharacterized protein LOC114317157 isoform X3 [Camellia sinensis]|uniref:uncharacterized protein LOC114317157 isoform X3 n=1 Tax=Camellia sinensis TaxID=4442 RepID=UPI0010359B7F|nr:uncharacterized protein LOC114317157 isoform X3 [Camellia sinensis]XP_028119655.1 uncharacterized protein LOC114317157 isoform X3 [Camellia sinensis]